MRLEKELVLAVVEQEVEMRAEEVLRTQNLTGEWTLFAQALEMVELYHSVQKQLLIDPLVSQTEHLLNH